MKKYIPIELPSVAKWRKRIARVRLIPTLPVELCVPFVFELAFKELASLREDSHQVPHEHLAVFLMAYENSFRAVDCVCSGEDFSFDRKGWERIRLVIADPVFEIGMESSHTVGPYYLYRCILPALKFGLKATYFDKHYRVHMTVAEAAQGANFFCSWDNQLKILSSLNAVLTEFGSATNFTELAVYSDWLEERMMEPLDLPKMSAQLIAELDSSPEPDS